MSEQTVDVVDSGLVDASIPEVATESENAESKEPSETYAVTIDGDSEEVSLAELRDGYQRQSDYTRKTQALAAERQRLQQAEAIVSALEADPEGTIQALGQAFGVEDTMSQPSDSTESDWDADDPQTQRISKLEAQLESQAKVQRQQVLEKDLGSLKEKYGQFDEQELFQHALKNQIPNLEAAFAHMRFNEVSEKAQRLEDEAKVVEAKRDAAVVTDGGSRQVGAIVSSADSSTGPQTIREAFLQAKQALGT